MFNTLRSRIDPVICTSPNQEPSPSKRVGSLFQIFRICRHGKVPYRRFNSPEANDHVRFNESMGGSPVIGCAGREVLRHTRVRQGFRQGVV